jgi:hypothetical protein
VLIHEGRNRQVRRMCEAVGHRVSRLKRVRIGPITDEDIRPGEFRDLSEKEVAALKREASLEPGKRKTSTSTADLAGRRGTSHVACSTSHPAPGTRHVTSGAPKATARPTGSPRNAPDPRSRPRPRSDRPRRG